MFCSVKGIRRGKRFRVLKGVMRAHGGAHKVEEYTPTPTPTPTHTHTHVHTHTHTHVEMQLRQPNKTT
ncbi:hypothetical protein POVWA1_027610 [Plasmodium ovale wallikeri]|uniref:Uncharacterized protein n=1 Tax=Plasmodium ovale wallikeri TaxID=864142 RepID=A0A1A8YVE2_PLAOA|nr:hypothetical protein POVWA1_027610 [Plasmodium ovale wallikeri]